MNKPYADRRGVYFLFQGLLTAVLLLLFIYQDRYSVGWLPRFWVLVTFLGSSLVFLKVAPAELFSRWWVQTALFMADAGIITLTLSWTQPQSDFFLLYVLIVFGTALTRNFMQSFLLGLLTAALYLASAWKPHVGFPSDTAFWLRFDFLCVSTSLLAILSRDTHQGRVEQENLYQQRMIQFERLATLGRVAGEIAHRIKSPLTTILVNAEILAHQSGQSKKALEEIGQIEQAARHCQEILKNLLDLGRIEEMEFAPIDLRNPVEAALRPVAGIVERRRLRLDVEGLDSPKPVFAEASLLYEAIAALLQNAIDAVANGGRVHLRVERRRPGRWAKWSGRGETCVVVIEDNGKGIARKDLENVFQPFFSTKGKQGTGLGLSAALRILQKHNGTITASSAGPGHGARFELVLPAINRPGYQSAKVGRSARISKSR